MPEIPEELDVFRRPHYHMKQLVKDIEAELCCTNFMDWTEMHTLLAHLLTRFRQFKSHEEIENQYIVKELLPRLPSSAKATLENDIHSDNRLNDLVTLVDNRLQLKAWQSEHEQIEFGEHLKSSIANFTIDFIPHMDEEEEVYLPLLLEYFTESELRELTLRVLELHQLPQPPVADSAQQDEPLEDITIKPSLVTLPPELLLKILSYLSPRDLLRLAPLHSSLQRVSQDGCLWQHLHPVRWAMDHWHFFKPPMINDQKLVADGIIEDNDVTKELLSVGTSVNANLMKSSHYDGERESKEVQKELRVLCGIMDHLLPRVGSHVQTLDLSHGKAVSNEVVFRMLRQCPNLSYLDLSYTKISDFAFRGLLPKKHFRWKLEYVDLSGCSLITDTALQRLAQSLSSSPHLTPPPCSFLASSQSCGRGNAGEGGGGGGGEEKGGEESQLKCLILSGCYSVTDVGLRSLAVHPGLPHLHYLNLSGLPNVTQKGLSTLISASPNLPPDFLFYCDNIQSGPYSGCANGCQNIGSPNLQCCRQQL